MKATSTLLAIAIASLLSAQDPAPPTPPPGQGGKHTARAIDQRHKQLRQTLEQDFAKLKGLPEQEAEAAGDKLFDAFRKAAGALGDEIVVVFQHEPTGEAGAMAFTVAMQLPLEDAQRATVLGIAAEHLAQSEAIVDHLPNLQYDGSNAATALVQKVVDTHPQVRAKGIGRFVLAMRAKGPQKELQLEAVGKEFADVKYEDATLGVVAGRILHALRNIQIGKVPPDIVGKDMDGTPFQLSDYRGKVVVLDFWGFW